MHSTAFTMCAMFGRLPERIFNELVAAHTCRRHTQEDVEQVQDTPFSAAAGCMSCLQASPEVSYNINNSTPGDHKTLVAGYISQYSHEA